MDSEIRIETSIFGFSQPLVRLRGNIVREFNNLYKNWLFIEIFEESLFKKARFLYRLRAFRP